MSRFRIDVADLLGHPGVRRPVRLTEPVEDLAGSAARVVDPITVDVDLERISEGIVVRGAVRATWRAECSRCLGAIAHPLELHVDELFDPHPVVGETYPLEGHEIDLEQLVRDTVLLELPLAPHCDQPCTPTSIADARSGDALAEDRALDPRWAALSELEI
jgi:uncharacterized protein